MHAQMSELIPVLTRKDISYAVTALAKEISYDYREKELVLIGVLKGAFVFLSDLARCLSIPVKIDFITASSYGDGTTSSGKIRITETPSMDLKDKHVLLVEDIVDTGLTAGYLAAHLKSLGSKTVKLCAMIDKRERREKAVKVDYAGSVVEKGFLVGYGLDYDEQYRNLPEIYHLKL